MCLLKTGLLGLSIVVGLSCSSASTGNKARVSAEGGPCAAGGGCDPGLACTAGVCDSQANVNAAGNRGSNATGGLRDAGSDVTVLGSAGASGNSASSTENPNSRKLTPALFASTTASSQWVQTNWLASNSYFSLYASQDRVLARGWDSLNGGRTFLTADSGATWSQLGSTDSAMDIQAIVQLNDAILAGTWNGLYLSTSGGTSWNALTPAEIPADTAIRTLVAVETTLFASSKGHIYRSSDNANSWTDASSGLSTSATVVSIVKNGNAFFAGTDGNGIVASTNGGTSWTTVNSGLADTHISQLAALGARLFAVTLSGVFVSDNNGTTWVADSSNLKAINCLLVANGQLFSGTDNGGVYLSGDSGGSWTSFGAGMPDGSRVWSLTATTDSIFAGTDSGIWRTVLATGSNGAPSVVTAPTAIPNPVTGTTSNLSVLGADDGGEENLTYTWATIGTAPAPVTFGMNGTNAAKATTAAFTSAGNYTFQVTVKDQGSLTAVSSVTATVSQTLTSIVVSPSSATVNASAKQQFTATARDQFAANLTAQPTFLWSVGGGGTVSSSGLFTAGTTAGGPYPVTAQSSGVSGIANATVVKSTAYQIDCGGGAASPYTADQYYSGGTARTVTNSITMTGVTDPAPQAVYQAERYGTVTYTLPNLAAGAAYTARLHFAELYWTATKKRIFNVAINGTTVLSNFDIYAATGARYKATVKEFATTASASGQIVIKFTNVTDNATIEGIQLIPH